MENAVCIAGDARSESTYEAALQGAKADALLTDPPYCLLTRRRKHGDLREPRGRKLDHPGVVRFESVRDYRAFTEAWLTPALAHLVPGAPLVIWTNFLGKAPIATVAALHGYQTAGEFLWAKRTRSAPGAGAPHEEGLGRSEETLRLYEVALVLLREPLPPEAPADPPRCWSAISHYEEGEAAISGDHPHHKPASALEPLVRAWTRPGQLVLDPFAGSGSIGVALLRLGRRAACAELNAEWARGVEVRLAARAEPSTGAG